MYLPRIDSYLCADEDAELERVQRERRELFVAMTRARDGVWMSQLSSFAIATADVLPVEVPATSSVLQIPEARESSIDQREQA